MSELLDEIVLAADQADAIRLSTGFWPVLGHYEIDALETADFSDGEPAGRFQDALQSLYRDRRLRPALVEFWWRALHTRTILDDDDQDERLREYSQAFQECVEAVLPSSIESDDQIRWELDIAATTGNVSRVLRLLDELKHRSSRNTISQNAVRMLFLLTPCIEIERPVSGTWDPNIQLPGAEQLYRAYSGLVCLAAMRLHHFRVPPTPNGPATLRKELPLSHVRSIREWVDISRDSGSELSHEVRAIDAWVTYCLGLADRRLAEAERAGVLYENAPDFDWQIVDHVGKAARLEAAAISYQDGGNFDKALSCAQRWAEVTPADSRAQRKIAELCWRMGNLEDALKAFERGVDDEAPSDRAWEQTALLQLGLERLTSDASAKAIERAADQTPLKDQGQRLSAWMLPWFDALSAKAKERFWFGLYAVSSAHLLDNTGQAAWDNAGDNFGEALAFELKHRVIEPFFAQRSDGSQPLPDKHWVNLSMGRATLGELIECLLSALKTPNAVSLALRKWLEAHHKSFFRELERSASDLRRLYELRGQAQHGTLSQAGVRYVFSTVCRALAALTAD